jgi:hypothetical protein
MPESIRVPKSLLPRMLICALLAGGCTRAEKGPTVIQGPKEIPGLPVPPVQPVQRVRRDLRDRRVPPVQRDHPARFRAQYAKNAAWPAPIDPSTARRAVWTPALQASRERA